MRIGRSREPLEDGPAQPERRVITKPLAPFHPRPDVASRAPDVDRNAKRRRIASDLLAAPGDHGQCGLDLRGRQRVEVELIGKPSGQPPGDGRAVTAHDDRDARLLEPLRLVDRLADVGVATFVCRPAGGQHPGDDLQVVGEDRQPFAGSREAVAVGPPLVLLPAAADPELHPTAAHDVEGRDRLGRETRISVGRRQDEVPQAGAGGRRRDRRELDHRLEDDRLLGRRIHLHVVIHPERLEAGRLRPASDLDRPLPGLPGLHPEVFAVAPLGQRQADLHEASSGARHGP